MSGKIQHPHRPTPEGKSKEANREKSERDKAFDALVSAFRQFGRRTADSAGLDFREFSKERRQELAELLAQKFEGRLSEKAKKQLQSEELNGPFLNKLVPLLPELELGAPTRLEVLQDELLAAELEFSLEAELMPQGLELQKQLKGASLREPMFLDHQSSAYCVANQSKSLSFLFPAEMIVELKKLGIKNARELLEKVRSPEFKAELLRTLGCTKAMLNNALRRAELLSIGPGSNHELAIQARMLPTLFSLGLGSLDALIHIEKWAKKKRERLIEDLRTGLGRWRYALQGKRYPKLDDLKHWAQEAKVLRRHYSLIEEKQTIPLSEANVLEHFYRLRLEIYEQELESNERELLFRADPGVVTPRHQIPSEKGKDTIPQVKPDPAPPMGLTCWWIIEEGAVQTQQGRRTRRTQICMDPATQQVSIHQVEVL